MRIEHIGRATLYQGDCLEILPTLEVADVTVTDPPYGVGDGTDRYAFDGITDTFEDWIKLMERFLPIAMERTRGVVTLPTSKIEGEAWIWRHTDPLARIIWYKGATTVRAKWGFRDTEMVFLLGEKHFPWQIHDHMTFRPLTGVEREAIDHPTPKPIEWPRWLVYRLTQPADLVRDPFMGSGTTGVACVELGRPFSGIEQSPKYFDVACRRIEEAVKQGRLFDDKPVAQVAPGLFE